MTIICVLLIYLIIDLHIIPELTTSNNFQQKCTELSSKNIVKINKLEERILKLDIELSKVSRNNAELIKLNRC